MPGRRAAASDTLLLGFALALALLFQTPAWGASENIRLLHSHITVQSDAVLHVTETVTIQCAQDRVLHGITRSFAPPFRRAGIPPVRIRMQGVMMDGEAVPYTLSTDSDGLHVSTGDPQALVPPGIHTFTFEYLADRQIGYFEDYDELFWDVTGSSWPFIIDKAEAVVELPPLANILDLAAYTGSQGARNQDFTSGFDEAGNPWFATSRRLYPGDGLRVRVTWPKGFIRRPGVIVRMVESMGSEYFLHPALACLLALCLYYLLGWRLWGKNPVRRLEPEALAPPDTPLCCGAARYSLARNLDPGTLAAAVLHLAAQGGLMLRATEENTALVPRGPVASLDALSRTLHQSLFSGGNALVLDQDARPRLDSARAVLHKACARFFWKQYLLFALKRFPIGVLLLILIPVLVVLAAPEPAPALLLVAGLALCSAACWWTGKLFFSTWQRVLKQQAGIQKGLLASLPALAVFSMETMLLGYTAIRTSPASVLCLAVTALCGVVLLSLLKSFTLKLYRDRLLGYLHTAAAPPLSSEPAPSRERYTLQDSRTGQWLACAVAVRNLSPEQLGEMDAPCPEPETAPPCPKDQGSWEECLASLEYIFIRILVPDRQPSTSEPRDTTL